jgi:hypothetical protein
MAEKVSLGFAERKVNGTQEEKHEEACLLRRGLYRSRWYWWRSSEPAWRLELCIGLCAATFTFSFVILTLRPPPVSFNSV